MNTIEFRNERDWQVKCESLLPIEVRFALSSITVGERYFAQFNTRNHEFPVWVRMEGSAVSPCGEIKVAAYCPADKKIYVDLEALKRKWLRFGTAVIPEVIWHEMAHWWQDVEQDKLFLYGKVDNAYDREVVELPADCYAGHISQFSKVLNEYEIREAANLFGSIGSGANSTHGSNTQRRNSFLNCYKGENK